MMHKKGLARKNAGFTLVEMIVVVAIVVALLAVTMFSLVTIRKQLRQRELDSKAETIYVTVQRRMVELRASGFESLYAFKDGDNGVTKLGMLPSDVSGETEMTEDTLCLVTYAGDGTEMTSAADALMTEQLVDEELRSNQWVIEFNPESGSVYGVFYSESGEIPDDAAARDALRTKKARLKQGAKVGYYGGDLTQSGETDRLYPGILVDNAEELKVTFYCNNPSTDESLTFKITLSDGKNTYTRTLEQSELTRISAHTYRYVWTLDSLKSEETRFQAQTEGKLSCGGDLQIRLTVSSSDAMVDDQEVEETTNGLYAYREGTAEDTALIACGRHLQNLEAASGVKETITKAQQISDISFRDDAGNDEDWYSLYGDTFRPIVNSNLTLYDAQSDLNGTAVTTSIHALHIPGEEGQAAGLFRTFSGTVKNVTLTGTRVDQGTNVGALIGETSGEVMLENCRVLLSTAQGDLEELGTKEKTEDISPRLSGNTVGGLIGQAGHDVTLTGSFASTVLRGTVQAGGLIGQAEAKVTANQVYADSYIVAPVTGGLLGGTGESASVTLENFYAAGYQAAENTAAGIAAGNITSAKNGYSACSFVTSATTLSTAKSGKMENVYYLSGGSPLSGSEGCTYKELTQKGDTMLGDAFTLSSADATYPYNLLNQGLTTYSYPRLQELDHYGDWEAEFESGKLVYYEKYSDGTYGFAGANVTTLSEEKNVIGDGYALVYTEDKKPQASQQITVTTSAGAQTFKAVEAKEVVSGENKYYLVSLPKEVNNPDLSKAEEFYQKITVKDDGIETTYYFNPYFAKTVVESDTAPKKAPTSISVRTARHLYGMSLYYAGFADDTTKSTFGQEMDIDYSTYEWAAYSGVDSLPKQAPIDAEYGFAANYNGGYHRVKGVSVESEQAATGLFGTVAKGATVRNLFLTGRTENGKAVETVTRKTQAGTAATGTRESSQIGALVGVNNGTVSNCAVSGYTMKYYAYNYNEAAIGGLVGENNGTIRSCSADAAGITLTSYNADVYAGGFVGRNNGTVTASYSTGRISVLDSRSTTGNSTVRIGGFAGENGEGTTRRCYAATALTAAGSTEVYGFARIGGAVADCRYLDGGSYFYAGDLYAYNTSTNDYAALSAGEKITGEELERLSLSGFSKARASYEHDLTGTEGDDYPFPAVVSEGGTTVHFGNWPVQESIGTMGVFYWEYEAYGSNSGYHFSYLGRSENTTISGNTLCTEHDDGGVITKYGYGYFYKEGEKEPELTVEKGVEGTVNTEAGNKLQEQMAGYVFVAYETGESGLRTDTFTRNSTWKLTSETESGDKTVYTFSVSPFFADAFSLDAVKLPGGTEQSVAGSVKPGEEGNEYQVRSEAQLQFINWNSAKKTTSYSINSAADYTNTSGDPGYSLGQRYPYLLSGKKGDATPTKEAELYWVQSHDIDAYQENGRQNVDFTPIGSLFDTAIDAAEADAYTAYFPYTYDGQSYAIKNISIHSSNQSIGLFGVTSGASLRNIVLYSDRGNEIVKTSNGNGWYTMGGLVGFAGSKKGSATESTESEFTNCTVSGYTIIDRYEQYPGWGGGNVGGLVGTTNMDITNCSAVNDIELRSTYNQNQSYKNLRVGGIAGVARCTINSCYAGGSIRSYVTQKDTGNANSMCIWVGGIAGGIVVRNTGNLGTLLGYVDRTLLVTNCYSYVDLPAGPKSLEENGYNHVRASMSIASGGEMLSPTYWFTKNDVPQRTVRIYNCYALASASSKTTDYKNYGNDTNWSSKNINALENTDKVYVTNTSGKMYLTYDEMASSLKDYLTAGVSNAVYSYGDNKTNSWNSTDVTVNEKGNFSTVTVTENGVSIKGKYSYPGNDSALDGQNYPFPTVLTQTDVFGSKVNVHYGAWPKYALYWETPSATIDLYANRTGDKQEPLLEVKLRVDQGLNLDTLTKDKITFYDDGGEAYATGESPVEVESVSALQTDGTGSYYLVTLKGIREGRAFVRATLNEKTAETVITVVSELRIKGGSETISLNADEEKTVELSLYIEKDGKETKIKPEKSQISYTVSLKSGEEAVIFGEDNVTYDPSSGTLKVTVIGSEISALIAQEGHISVTVTYTYGSGAKDKMSATAEILTETQPLDYVSIKLGDSTGGNRYSRDGKTLALGEMADDLSTDGLYLRGNAEDGTLKASDFTFRANATNYTVQSDGSVIDSSNNVVATLVLGNKTTYESAGYTYYSLKLENYTLPYDGTLSVTVGGHALSVTVPAKQEQSVYEGEEAQAAEEKKSVYDAPEQEPEAAEQSVFPGVEKTGDPS